MENYQINQNKIFINILMHILQISRKILLLNKKEEEKGHQFTDGSGTVWRETSNISNISYPPF